MKSVYRIKRKQKKIKRNFRYGLATVIFISGISRLVPSIKILLLNLVPNLIPFPEFIIYTTGVIEVALAIMLLFPKTKRLAGWLFITLLPAHFEIFYYRLSESTFHNNLILVFRSLLLVGFGIWAYLTTKPDDI